MKIQWSHCVVRCRDLEAMVAFYSETLGFQIADRGTLGADTEIVFLSGSSSDHHQIAFLQSRGDEDASSLEHMAFRVESLDDVKAMAAKVGADDRVGFSAPLTHGNAVSVYFADPEGNGIEVFCDSPWHVQQPQLRGWDPEQSNDEVLAVIESEFVDEPGFMAMADYRAQQAAKFGEN
jgi:catechol 2,3-dioxygenase